MGEILADGSINSINALPELQKTENRIFLTALDIFFCPGSG